MLRSRRSMRRRNMTSGSRAGPQIATNAAHPECARRPIAADTMATIVRRPFKDLSFCALVQLFFDHLHERALRLRTGKQSSIDEEGRRTLDAEPRAFRFVLQNSSLEFAALHAILEGSNIQLRFGCILVQLFRPGRGTGRIKQAPILPEFALLAGAARSLMNVP